MLPSKVVLEGTIRAFERLSLKEPGSVAELLAKHVERLSAAHSVVPTFEVRPGAPPTQNDERLYSKVVPQLQRQFGTSVRTSLERGMFSEDFAYYTASLPALYFGLGIMKDGLGDKPVHTPDFTIHPDTLKSGTALLVALAGVDLQDQAP